MNCQIIQGRINRPTAIKQSCKVYGGQINTIKRNATRKALSNKQNQIEIKDKRNNGSSQDEAELTLDQQPANRFLYATAMFSICFTTLQLMPEASQAAGIPTSPADFLQIFMSSVDSLGPLGPILFILTVGTLELIPLFPTQPISLASGLLFGGVKGSILMLLGLTTAALAAFTIARGVGRPFAERMIQHEMGESDSSSAIKDKMSDVVKTIENGSALQQFTAVIALRLIPVLPFSVANYMLGMTPVRLSAYTAATMTGMSVWAVMFATLGAAGRELLEGGNSMEAVLSAIAADVQGISSNVGVASLIALGIAGGVLLVKGAGQEGGLEGVVGEWWAVAKRSVVGEDVTSLKVKEIGGTVTEEKEVVGAGVGDKSVDR